MIEENDGREERISRPSTKLSVEEQRDFPGRGGGLGPARKKRPHRMVTAARAGIQYVIGLREAGLDKTDNMRERIERRLEMRVLCSGDNTGRIKRDGMRNYCVRLTVLRWEGNETKVWLGKDTPMASEETPGEGANYAEKQFRKRSGDDILKTLIPIAKPANF